MTERRRGPNPWMILLVGAVVGLPVSWWIFNQVVGLIVRVAS
jgi:hypothetical protein